MSSQFRLKDHYKFLNNKWIVGIGTGIIVTALSYYFFDANRNQYQIISNSSDSINTVGQVGDNTLVVNDKMKEPVFRVGSFTKMIKNDNGLFSGSFLFEVSSTVILKSVYLKVPINSLVSCHIAPAEDGVLRAVSCNAFNNIAYIKLVDAIGLYKVDIFTNSNDIQNSGQGPGAVTEYESY